MWHPGIIRASVVEVDTSGHSRDNIPLFLVFMLSWLKIHIYHTDRNDTDLLVYLSATGANSLWFQRSSTIGLDGIWKGRLNISFALQRLGHQFETFALTCEGSLGFTFRKWGQTLTVCPLPWHGGGPHHTSTAFWHFPGSVSLLRLVSSPLTEQMEQSQQGGTRLAGMFSDPDRRHESQRNPKGTDSLLLHQSLRNLGWEMLFTDYLECIHFEPGWSLER